MDSSIVTLGDVRAEDAHKYGPKAANLAVLRRAGLPVPDGVAIASEMIGRPPGEMMAKVLGCLEESLAAADGPWAVRSSSLDEDGTAWSRAGQFETFLDIATEELAETIQRCGFPKDATGSIPVLVQPMVASDVAGVLFTMDPVTADPSIAVVEAAAVRGDRLTGGEIDPERWEIIAEEPRLVTAGPSVLSEADVIEIRNLGLEIADLMEGPQDIEWVRHDGRLTILQSRPVTGFADVVPVRPNLDPPDSFTWVLDGGHFPEPVSPMGSEAGVWVEEAFPVAFGEFGALVQGFRSVAIGWRVYARVIPLGGREGRRSPPWWLLGFLARVVPSLRQRVRTAHSARRTRLDRQYLENWEREWGPALRTEIGERRQVDLSTLTDRELVDELEDRFGLGRETALVHFRLFVPHILAVYRFVNFCQEHLGWTSDDTARRMVGLSPGTRRQVDELDSIAELIRGRDDLASLFDHNDPDLSALREDVSVGNAIDAYLGTYGPRPPAIDITEPTLQETPHLLTAQLANLVRHPANREKSVSDALDAVVLEPSLREQYDELLADLRAAYAVRDDNVLWTIDLPTGLLRLAAIEIGKRLHMGGRLDDPEHVVYLYRPEATSALLEGVDYRDLVARRRGERLWSQAHPPKRFYGPPPSPPPNFRGLPYAAKEINEALIWMTGHDTQADVGGDGLEGVGASRGVHRGPVRIVRGESDFQLVQPGDVIVAPIANPAWAVLFPMAGALVTDTGGILSHAAILAREFGIPAVMGAGNATGLLADGQVVLVNGTTGSVQVE